MNEPQLFTIGVYITLALAGWKFIEILVWITDHGEDLIRRILGKILVFKKDAKD